MARTVVIVDDSKFLIKQITEFFSEKLGFTVVAEGFDGEQAVQLYKKFKPDLITLDITMPNKDGKTALQEIIAEDSKARVIMISAIKGSDMLACLSMGAKGYVEKPLKFGDANFAADFTATVEEALKN